MLFTEEKKEWSECAGIVFSAYISALSIIFKSKSVIANLRPPDGSLVFYFGMTGFT
jgi:hypothetical protein